ncbi:mediator complex subunit [Saccharomycopsis crataegensis]|uniref:Mediator of RNA polymerase II transcription subunit 6 n=1 Tax=Saccharomycopsis crataegensis TaxID=43959 RepID=A0AAV5QS41_9ASCO|nr:mediator complex subunit [Saccharomycopsis crataegensis]
MSADTPLDELQWSSPEWIQMFGLNSYNVLEYFSQSPFYDRASNNQVLKMQYQFHPHLMHMPQSHHEFVSALQKMSNGTEFVVHLNGEPTFYIIRKQQRHSPGPAQSSVQILHDYYIINANIYQSPSVFGILNSRLLSCVLSFKQSFNILNGMNNFNSGTGHQYVATDIQNNIVELEAKINAINKNEIESTNPTVSSATTGNMSMKRANNGNIGNSVPQAPSTGSNQNTPGNVGINAAASAQGSTRQPPAVVFDRLLGITMKELKSAEPDFGSKNLKEEIK